ncbi:uncharacterized protein BDW47DRAFT_125612 [Aspergillus candidus]|uniref:Uncharacterized protein n=1 Tax=Aspergillus candidus TaxID=41067 RepID=A0A2I2FC50_ASPCN|nr:hypothetical protein BDW47DRAFT_125612 [Aspergillus candidus]PLB38177.1 hypothetical protein BDW47DRAFT_125612 [Aspergillus candidus]
MSPRVEGLKCALLILDLLGSLGEELDLTLQALSFLGQVLEELKIAREPEALWTAQGLSPLVLKRERSLEAIDGPNHQCCRESQW